MKSQATLPVVYDSTRRGSVINVNQMAVWQKYKDIASQHSYLPNIRNFIVHLTSYEWSRD